MGLLFENPNAKSLFKKWCATSMLPICTPLQVPSLKTKRPYAKIAPMEVPKTIGTILHNKEKKRV